MQAETNPLGYEPIGKLLGTFAVPSIISMPSSAVWSAHCTTLSIRFLLAVV